MIAFAPLLLRAAPYLAAAGLAVAAYHNAPLIGPGARIDRLVESRDDWKDKADASAKVAKGWEKSFRDSEAARRVDQVAAGNAITASERACDARLTEARRSTKVIERIINAPPKSDATGCPARSLVDPGLLRDALHPPG